MPPRGTGSSGPDHLIFEGSLRNSRLLTLTGACALGLAACQPAADEPADAMAAEGAMAPAEGAMASGDAMAPAADAMAPATEGAMAPADGAMAPADGTMAADDAMAPADEKMAPAN